MAATGAESHNPESRSHRTRFIIIAVVIALALTFMIWAAFGENTRYFLTVSEFSDKQAGEEIADGQMVRVSGKLVEGTFERPEKSTLSSFQITDKEGTQSGAVLLPATYDGVLPDLFFNPHSEIILEGSYDGHGTFQANEILVKCPSKYQDLEEQQGEEPEYGTST